MTKPLTFLIIDDEPPILIGLKKLIISAFPDSVIYTALGGDEGWELVCKHHPTIVISDIAMPGTMDGMTLLFKIREKQELSDIYFIVITGIDDKAKKIELLKKGADDYTPKPIQPDEFLARISSGLRVIELQQKMLEEKIELEKLKHDLELYIQDLTKLALKFMQARIPESYEMLLRISSASTWIATSLGEFSTEEIHDIETAAYFCQAGRIFLPDAMLKQPVLIDGRPSDNLMFQIPVSAREIVSTIPRFQNIGKLLYHIYENFDGSGFPDRIQSWQIPLGSRIIRVALDYEELRVKMGKPAKYVMEILMQGSKRLYDHRILALIDQWAISHDKAESARNDKAVQLVELEDGMILARDIITNSGLKLMPTGAVLHEKTINRILSHNTSDPILGNIYVRK